MGTPRRCRRDRLRAAHATRAECLARPSASRGCERWRPVFVGAHSEQHVAYEDVRATGSRRSRSVMPCSNRAGNWSTKGTLCSGQGGLSVLTTAFVDVGESTYREVVAVDLEGNRSVIWSFYDIEGESFVVPIVSQLWYGIRALTSRPDSAAVRVQGRMRTLLRGGARCT